MRRQLHVLQREVIGGQELEAPPASGMTAPTQMSFSEMSVCEARGGSWTAGHGAGGAPRAPASWS